MAVRIAVISDTHGEFVNLTRACELLGPVDWLLHGGDFYRDARICARQLGLPEERVRAVVGNCDYHMHEPGQELLTIEGVTILLTHGHYYGVKQTLDRVYYKAKEHGARVAVFGHSHVAVNVDEGGVLLFNPGSLTSPRRMSDRPSCGLLEVHSGDVAGRIIPIEG